MIRWLIVGAAAWWLFVREFGVLPPAVSSPAKHGETGIASWYGPGYVGNKTANGETFTAQKMTAAHKTLPFGTWVRVTDLATGRSVDVRINDRGPYVAGRIIDLSQRAAEELGIKQKGLAQVRVERV